MCLCYSQPASFFLPHTFHFGELYIYCLSLWCCFCFVRSSLVSMFRFHLEVVLYDISRSSRFALKQHWDGHDRKEHTISPGLLKSNCAFYRPLDNSGLFGNFLIHTTQKTVLPPEAVVLKSTCNWKETKYVGTSLSRGTLWLHIVLFLLLWNIDFKT